MVKKINTLLLGLVFFWAPLTLSMRAADGFTLPKEITAGAALVFLLGQALGGDWKGLWRSWLSRWMVFFAVWLLADSLTVGLLKMEALKGFVHVFLMAGSFLAVAWALTRGFSYEKLVHLSLFSGGILALYGVVQALGWDRFIAWNNRFDGRVFSTLGNPNYLAGHLSILLPVAFLLGLRAGLWKVRWFWFSLTALMLVGLGVTRVRGADLAFAGSFGFMAVFLVLPWGRKLARRNLGVLLSFLGILLAVGTWWLGHHGGFSIAETSVQQRLATYRVTWEMVKDHPWCGIGVGHLSAQYPLYQYRPYAPSEYPQHPFTITAHVHNEYLQFLAEGGWPALLLFLAVLISFVLAMIKLFRNPSVAEKDKELLIGIGAGVVAALIQALSNFPFQIAPTAVVFGLWLAAPLAFGSGEGGKLKTSSNGFFKMTLALAATACFLSVGLKAFEASVAQRNTEGESSLGNHANALYYAERLTALSSGNYQAWFAYGKALEGVGKMSEAVAAYQKSIAINPNHVLGLATLANLQLRSGSVGEALLNCDKAQTLVPNYPGPFWLRATGLYQLRRYEEASQEYLRYIDYDPNSAQAFLNLGVCYIQLKRKAEAVEAWKKSYALDPNNPQTAQYLKSQGVSLK
jgi:O-antigen ligase